MGCCALAIAVKDGAEYGTGHAARLGCAARAFACAGQVFLHGVGQVSQRQRLQPYAAGAGERGQKDTVAAEEDHAYAGHTHDLKAADVAGVCAECFARCQVADDDFARQLKLCGALTVDALQQKAIAAKDAAPSDC